MKNQHHDTKKLIARLNRIEGQIKGIKRMLVEDEPCDEIIIQLSSIKASIQGLSKTILLDHFNHCVMDPVIDGETEPEFSSMLRALDQYTKMI